MRVSGFRLRTGSVVAAGPSTPFVTKNDWPPDQKQLSYAVENDWILVTFDDDFLSLVEGSGLEHAGIIYVQQAGRDIGGVVKAIDAHLENREEDDRGIHYC